jgi:hypothetical protein
MKNCPKCAAAMLAVSPKTISDTVFACYVCGHTETSLGKEVVKDGEQMADLFRAASLSNKVVAKILQGQNADPAISALMQAEITGLGAECWMDGYKQGILVSAVRMKKEDRQ